MSRIVPSSHASSADSPRRCIECRFADLRIRELRSVGRHPQLGPNGLDLPLNLIAPLPQQPNTLPHLGDLPLESPRLWIPPRSLRGDPGLLHLLDLPKDL